MMSDNPPNLTAQLLSEKEALQRATELIRQNEFRLRTLFNSAHDAIFTMDYKTFTDCNDATLRIFQCKKEDIVGQTPYRFSPAYQSDGRTSEEAAMEKINAVLAGEPQFFEWRHIRLDGTPFEAEVSLNRLDLEGDVQILAIVRDINDRKKAEAENQLLALVANATTNMVVIANSEGKIEWVNPSFERTTGYTLNEVIGKKPGTFLRGPLTDPEASKLMGGQLRAGKGFKNIELINYTKDLKPYWVSIEVQPVYDKHGKVSKFIAIESDITERKESQQALEERNEELVKINAELDRFVYSASHDLRAPIASLLGLIEVARLEKDPTSLEQLLDLKKKSLLRLDHFIKDIVDHSRNMRLQVEAVAVNFETLIHNAFEQLQFMDNMERIWRVVDVKQEGDFYSAPSRLAIILNNLISNAIKYADLRKENPSLEVRVNANPQQAILRVTDNGEGIPHEALPKIFDMFYRASTKGVGSGLGLYIVKEAVEKIGGNITVHSEPGKGTEFEIVLPAIERVN
ncbi:MAG: PAS domain S-box protein [Cyclobacteriaceae bacterium]|nr:PAS domain S-box protein [Cyclobacteriaceae bacterium]UYN85387.1 MAG: PAS domain S-box protein [Cyclobacteriaceae bacterium]